MGSFPSRARSAAKIAFCKEPAGKVLFVEYEILGFGIWNTAQGIRNPTKNGIWNQFSTEKKIRSPVTGIWNPWLGIQNLRLSWIGKKKRHVSSLVSLLSLLFVRSHYLRWFSGPLDKILLVCNTIANGLTGQGQYYIRFYRSKRFLLSTVNFNLNEGHK